jgi:sigma-B regulation protein RsbU (phosphoserine phosphatase)
VFESFERVEVVPSPLSVGTLASRIATQLRLRKAAGLSNERSSLAEINAALRDHNTRFQKDLEEARSIQQGLLPKQLPSDPRFQIAVSYQPLEQVGGDWYFVDFPNHKHLRLHIADVSGHGLPAAFIGSMAKLAMVAAERERPDELLSVMNKYLAPQLPSGRFMTMGTCLYDPATGRVQWARAGHGPALILSRASNEVTQLLGNGFPLGFVTEASYELIEHTLEPGDSLLLYTDGLTEAQNRDMQQFGVERLSAALSAAPSKGGSGEVLRSIVDAFTTFLEGRLLKDDVTLMLLRREE